MPTSNKRNQNPIGESVVKDKMSHLHLMEIHDYQILR
jgi:hypothetical protein